MYLPIMSNANQLRLKNMGKKGVFIVIEGLDGSGKTTQAELLTERLSKNYKAVYTAEPSQAK